MPPLRGSCGAWPGRRAGLLPVLAGAAGALAAARLFQHTCFSIARGPRGRAPTPAATRVARPAMETALMVDEAAKMRLVDALRKDLTDQYTDGWTYTPFAPDVQFVDPLVSVEGRLAYELMWEPMWGAANTIMDPQSLTFTVKSIRLMDVDDDPLASVAYPPRTDAAPLKENPSFAVHVVWETSGVGRFNMTAPILDVHLLEQQDFYMSGQDVFYVDAEARVIRHESAWDQSPQSLAAYLNPLAHLAPVKSLLPDYMLPTKPTDQSTADEGFDANTSVSGQPVTI